MLSRVGVLVGLLTVAALASADPAKDAEAKRLFEELSKTFALGDFQKPVDNYCAAYTAPNDYGCTGAWSVYCLQE